VANNHVYRRLEGIQTMLRGVHQSGGSMSSASKGTERAAFVDDFLAGVLPPVYRFGTGDAIDSTGRRSGQLDVVVENPFMPSLPLLSGSTRLYLAEGVAAVVEVKSDVASQWDSVLATRQQLEPLRRTFGRGLMMGQGPLPPAIPLFAVGYVGWKTPETVAERLKDGQIAGVLVIDPGVFVSGAHFGGITATGPWALWGLITCLHRVATTLQAAVLDPFVYAPTRRS
jgi:hypothetical protein